MDSRIRNIVMKAKVLIVNKKKIPSPWNGVKDSPNLWSNKPCCLTIDWTVCVWWTRAVPQRTTEQRLVLVLSRLINQSINNNSNVCNNNSFWCAVSYCIGMGLVWTDFCGECSPLLISSLWEEEISRGSLECCDKICTSVVFFFILRGAADDTCPDTSLYTGSETEERSTELGPPLSFFMHSCADSVFSRSSRPDDWQKFATSIVQ